MDSVELETRPDDLDPVSGVDSAKRLIRARALQLAFLVNDVFPDGEEKDGVIRCLEDAMAWVQMAAKAKK